MIKKIIYSVLAILIGLFLFIFPEFLKYFNSETLPFDIAAFLDNYPFFRYFIGTILLVIGICEFCVLCFLKLDKTSFVIQKGVPDDYGILDLHYSRFSKGNHDEIIYTNLATLSKHTKSIIDLEKQNIKDFFKNLPAKKEISFLGIATTPSLVYAGYTVGESGRKVRYFHWYRNKNKAKRVKGKKGTFELCDVKEDKIINPKSKEYTICVSTSYLINKEIVYNQFGKTNIVFYQIPNIGPDVIKTEKDLRNVALKIRSEISKISLEGASVNLLLHCSSELCFIIGQKLNSPAMPIIRVYSFNQKEKPQWDWFIDLD